MYSKDDSFIYEILNLTNQFYIDYPDPPYHEIIRKEQRPYNCLLIQSHYDYFICIPYRSHINHKYSFRFKHSKRSKIASSGLDYSKIVIIKNSDYLNSSIAIIDKDEYNETIDNIDYIKNDSQTYIDDYVKHILVKHILGKSNKYDEKEFSRIYKYSTLQYFHNELGIYKS